VLVSLRLGPIFGHGSPSQDCDWLHPRQTIPAPPAGAPAAAYGFVRRRTYTCPLSIARAGTEDTSGWSVDRDCSRADRSTPAAAVRFPLRHDVDAASVTYLRDIDLIARAVDAQLARYRGRTSGATDRVG
jgi:hypothetical protein